MDDADRLDELLEPLTMALVALTERRGGKGVALEAQGWSLRFTGGPSSLGMQLLAEAGMPALNDFQLSLIYRLHFERREGKGPPQFFVQYTVRKPHHWEEQTLRELALEVLALLYYVLGCPAATVRLERR